MNKLSFLETLKFKNLEKSQEKFKELQNQPRDIKIEQAIQENAKKALEKARKNKEILERAKEIHRLKKLEITEESQKARESNIRHAAPEESRPSYAWGLDQRKFKRSQENRNDLQYRSKPDKKFDENERRERLGLVYLDDETLFESRRRIVFQLLK